MYRWKTSLCAGLNDGQQQIQSGFEEYGLKIEHRDIGKDKSRSLPSQDGGKV